MRASIRALLQRNTALKRDRRSRPYSWVNDATLTQKGIEAIEACRLIQEEHSVVYFIRCEDFIKIGTTRDSASRRMAEFTTGSPFDYSVVAEVCGDQRLEKKLHKIFSDYRHRREWFRIEGELQNFLSAIQGAKPEYKLITREQRIRLETRFSLLPDVLEA